MSKLTSAQKELIGYVNLVNEVGTYENKEGSFYCECGKYKPFNDRTVKALIDKGLVESTKDSETSEGVYFLKPLKTFII